MRGQLERLADPRGPWRGWPLYGIAFTGSLLLALGSPPQGTTVLIWLGFVPLTLAARLVPPDRRRRAFALGWVGGLCVGLVGFPWIAELLERFAAFPPWLAAVGLGVFSAWTAIPLGLWVILMTLGPTRGWRGVVWGAASWIVLAALWPSLFPYTVVIGFAEVPEWMQAAELGGLALVEAQVVVCGILLADALLASGGRARWGRVALAIAIPVVSYGLGAWRMAALDERSTDAPRVRFGIVQPNAPLLSRRRLEKMERLRIQSRLAEQEGAQVVVWPEAGAFPFRAVRPLKHDFVDPLRQVLLRHRLPTIFGAASIDPGEKWEYNTVFAMSAEGRVTGHFDKVILVPFGEYVPIVDPEWALGKVPGIAHNFAGEGPARFVITPASTPERPDPLPFSAGPLVCYEDIFPDFAREVAAQEGGIDAFVNLTIDTWFGVTAEPWEHLALAQFRSVEHRIPMVRSVAAGPSTVIDHSGRVASFLPLRGPTPRNVVPPERLVADVALPRNTADAPTIYARVGWALPWVSTVAIVLVVLVRIRRSQYSPRANAAQAEAGDDAAEHGAEGGPA